MFARVLCERCPDVAMATVRVSNGFWRTVFFRPARLMQLCRNCILDVCQ